MANNPSKTVTPATLRNVADWLMKGCDVGHAAVELRMMAVDLERRSVPETPASHDASQPLRLPGELAALPDRWAFDFKFLEAVQAAMPEDDFAPGLEGIELALLGYERVMGKRLPVKTKASQP